MKPAAISGPTSESCPKGYETPHVQRDMTGTRSGLRDRLERGYGMRAERIVEGFLFIGSFVFDDLRLAYIAFAMLVLQVLSPFAAPVALAWATFDRRVQPDRLRNLYYDSAGGRGAAAISCTVLTTAFLLIHRLGFPTLGRVLIACPAASCILSATVGFCAGCGHYVVARDLLVRAGILRGSPEGACDVDIESV
jgi:Domain of unknown function (DUF4395)